MHMQHFYATPCTASPLVIKYGGNAMPGRLAAGADPTLQEIAELWSRGWAVVLVHGGGPEIDVALAQRGIVTERIDGMRVTDEATLAITEAVLCGTLNKRMVRALAALGVPAVGISGQDGGTLVARTMRSESGFDLGYVGDITESDPRLVRALLSAGFVPVVAPIARSKDAAAVFNVNADLSAAALAGVLNAQAFLSITNVRRVLRDINDPNSAIDLFTPSEASAFARSAACVSGMKPKLLAAARAVTAGASASYICAAGVGAIGLALIAGDATMVRVARPTLEPRTKFTPNHIAGFS
jgi:acetylglutamate kinase